MNYSYKSIKHSVLIAFGLFLMFLTQSVSAQTLQSSVSGGNGQSFYSVDQCIHILKNDMVTINENIVDMDQANFNLNTSVLNYYTSMVNYWANKIASGQTTNSNDVIYAINYFLTVLKSPTSDTQEAMTTALSPAQVELIKAQTIDKLSH